MIKIQYTQSVINMTLEWTIYMDSFAFVKKVKILIAKEKFIDKFENELPTQTLYRILRIF